MKRALQKFLQPKRRKSDFDINLLLKNANQSLISFSGGSEDFCIGFVDMVGSTKISAYLTKEKACKYYGIFLNSMAAIATEFGAKIVKSIGDSLLFYFPQTNINFKSSIVNSLDCGMGMIISANDVNDLMKKENLPSVQYRLSLDYGNVMIANQVNSETIDIFGPSVNMCSKINRFANPNSMVIGGDLFQLVKFNENYKFKQIDGYCSGLIADYPIYSVIHDEEKKIL